MNKNYYAIIPANVRYDNDLTANAKLLYGEITALCNEKGYCWARNEYFSNLYGVSKKSISTWISKLVEKNYIKTEIEYKKGSKEILHRYIRIIPHPMEEKFHTPMEEKVKDNNTDINNTLNIYINIYSPVIAYLNEKAETNYKSTTKKTQQLIRARQVEGYQLEDFKTVIDKKVKEWKNTEMENYLRPETLFSPKFEGYLNQKEKNNGKKSSCWDGIDFTSKETETYTQEELDRAGLF